jgi:hypothetical protein
MPARGCPLGTLYRDHEEEALSVPLKLLCVQNSYDQLQSRLETSISLHQPEQYIGVQRRVLRRPSCSCTALGQALKNS